MIESVKIIISLTPVFLFLAALIFLDSYKLVKLRSVLFTIFIGGAVAVICLLLNSWLLELSSSNITAYKRYAAPIIEEFLKAVYLIYLIKTKKVGFLVDAAICGFAVGAGFALIENIYYLMAVESSDLLLWLVRGCGTAILHGGPMAIMGII
ncbi:MAG: PrsW family glutamic-type intramembrane protease, partial [Candidatus Zixiibacteriota bacterium]